MSSSEKTPSYGNWVPNKLLWLLWGLTAVLTVLLIVDLAVWKKTVLTVIFIIALVICIYMAINMTLMHHAFSFTGGKLTEKIHDFLIGKLNWNGKGKILDIGCGSGALIIRCAKKFPGCKATGMDYWGAEWDYAKEQCEENARIENIKDVEFIKGDAAHLPFEDESFDAAVSNFVFHEVHTESDKRALVREALRVIKKGGSFSFHDLFEKKRLYGDMNEFIEELKKEGISEIHYEPNTESLPFIPSYIKMMFNHLGILYGKK